MALLTSRWTPIIEKGYRSLTGPRIDYWKSRVRFQIVAAGRRSLKTEIGKRKLIDRATTDSILRHRGYFDERYAFLGPTRDQVKRVAWDDLKALTHKTLIKKIWESDLCIELITGTEIWALGLDKPSRVEGSPWDGFFCDEFADIPEGAWEKNIRPCLSDREGWAIVAGVPDYDKPNNDKFRELYDFGLSTDPKYDEYKTFAWASEDVLPDKEVEEARATTSPTVFRQEYRGSFESAPGRAYTEFVKNVNVNDARTQFDRNAPLFISCDFNYAHHNWGMYQWLRTYYSAPDEIYGLNSNVEKMIGETLSYLRSLKQIHYDGQRFPDVVFYGDYSGNQQKAEASHSAWKQIRAAFSGGIDAPNAEFRYKVQPPISDRIEKTQSYLMNASGEVRLYMNSKCVNLIRDFEKVTRSMLFSGNKTDILTHASDNCGYMLIQNEKDRQ